MPYNTFVFGLQKRECPAKLCMREAMTYVQRMEDTL